MRKLAGLREFTLKNDAEKINERRACAFQLLSASSGIGKHFQETKDKDSKAR